jgi:hypothetical protein
MNIYVLHAGCWHCTHVALMQARWQWHYVQSTTRSNRNRSCDTNPKGAALPMFITWRARRAVPMVEGGARGDYLCAAALQAELSFKPIFIIKGGKCEGAGKEIAVEIPLDERLCLGSPIGKILEPFP